MKHKKKILWTLSIGFLLANVVAYVHAYQFTHFSDAGTRTNPDQMTAFDKVGIIFTGIKNPRPVHKEKPSRPHETITVKSDVDLEAWFIQVPDSKGTIIMFHGYSGEKSSLLGRSEQFNQLGYSTFLVDFMGSGGSQGNSTSIGFYESREVLDCYQFIKEKATGDIHLFGTSMGAAAILKAAHESDIQPVSLILECPFGRLSKTVAARFKMMGIPAFPMSDVLTFWGGIQLGYWAFGHNPQDYAKNVKIPTLILFGIKDDRVSGTETDAIFNNLKGEKKLIRYPDLGHAVFTPENKTQWLNDVNSFLQGVDVAHDSSAGSE